MKKTAICLLLVACLGIHSPITLAEGLPAGISRVTAVEGMEEYRLPNGLQILLVPDDSKPTTTVNLTYRVGSRHEGQGETGMAHLLEHMLFKGTPKHPQVWAEFEKRGLRANGSTWFDRTNYLASFSANIDNLNWYLGWLADSMINSTITRKDLDTEMTVVRNEMEAGENKPDRILLQRTLSLMYDWHPYSKSTIGARSDVENVDIPNLQSFYKQYYQPDNATLIVSGRFDQKAVLAQIHTVFGPIAKPKRQLPNIYTLDPAQDGERSITLRRVGGTPSVYVGYHVPPGLHADFAALEVLGLVLGDEPSGRLHKQLTQKRLAASTFAWVQGLADPGFMILGAQLSPGQDVNKARSALLTTVENATQEPYSAEEIERAKRRWLKSWDQAFTNPETVGVSLSESIAQGDWRLFFALRDRVKHVSVQDVQRVAKTYVLPDNRTVAQYLPTDSPQRAPTPSRVDVAQALADFKPQVAAAKVEAFEATPENIEARTQRFETDGVRMAFLPKGTRGAAVQANLSLQYGDEKSLQGEEEVANAVAALLDKGTAKLSRQHIQDRLDELQTELNVSHNLGQLSITLTSKRQHLPAAVALVGELLREPSLTADSLEEMREQSLASLEAQRKEPASVAANALARWGNPYAKGDPRYERSFDEIEADLKNLKPAALKRFHQKFYGASSLQFSAVGDLDVNAVRSAVELAFKGWRSPQSFVRIAQPLVAMKPERMVLKTPDKQNATLVAKLDLPIAELHADYPALMIANFMLGGSGNSRLWKRVREAEGLSYDVRSNIDWNPHEPNSAWQISAIFAPQNRDKVEKAVREELARALKDGFTEQELAQAQQGLLNFRRLSRAQDGRLAMSLSQNLYLKRDFKVSAQIDAALSKLTAAQVNQALRQYIKPSDLVTALAGDFKDMVKTTRKHVDEAGVSRY